ncbi:hypothetical protein [Terrarubrum flagellatum]|uniref:hypothetical protein n=1 Tax=Terrirubrum flagellatum TaxID=2895980 RepID=UPI0031455A58
MNFDINALSERFLPWARDNWEALLAGLVILIVALYLRKLLVGSRARPATVPAAPQKPDTQALDVSTAAAAEITADIEAYAKALFTEDVGLIASRASANAPQALRFQTIAEAPFVYDGVIMRDLSLMPTSLIAAVSAHFRQGQVILDTLRRHAMLTPPEATPEERIGALKAVAAALAAGIDKAVAAAEKVDGWIARNGGNTDGARALADLPVAALRGAAVDRLGQRQKTYKTLREQAQARLKEIDALIDQARRTGGPGGKLDLTVVELKPGDKPVEQRAAE